MEEAPVGADEEGAVEVEAAEVGEGCSEVGDSVGEVDCAAEVGEVDS